MGSAASTATQPSEIPIRPVRVPEERGQAAEDSKEEGSSEVRRLVLVGAGHANVHVLKHFALHARPADVELVMVSGESTTWYSGAIPASIAGLYSRAHAQVEVERVAVWAGWRFIRARMEKVVADENKVILDTGEELQYDLCAWMDA